MLSHPVVAALAVHACHVLGLEPRAIPPELEAGLFEQSGVNDRAGLGLGVSSCRRLLT